MVHITLIVDSVKNVLSNIKLRIPGETLLKVPEPAVVHDAEEESSEEVTNDGGEEENKHVKNSQLH